MIIALDESMACGEVACLLGEDVVLGEGAVPLLLTADQWLSARLMRRALARPLHGWELEALDAL